MPLNEVKFLMLWAIPEAEGSKMSPQAHRVRHKRENPKTVKESVRDILIVSLVIIAIVGGAAYLVSNQSRRVVVASKGSCEFITQGKYVSIVIRKSTVNFTITNIDGQQDSALLDVTEGTYIKYISAFNMTTSYPDGTITMDTFDLGKYYKYSQVYTFPEGRNCP